VFELVFLGTSASAPSVRRSLSSAVVMSDEHRFMIDCGEGAQRQLLRSGLGFRRLDRILLTHGHLDHILGLGGLASTLGRWEALEELNIYGGASAIARVRALMEVVFGPVHVERVGITLNLLEAGVTFDGKKFAVTAFPVQHRGDGCFGFLFEEKTRRPFLAERAESLGIPHGPVRRTLALGETVTLPDGRTVDPEEVLGPPHKGAKLCFVGDVGRTGPLHKIAENADLLAIEATFLEPDRDLAKRHGHITAALAARLAQNAGVKQLVIHHVSRRYPTRDILAEARAIFPDTVVADDFDIMRVTKDKPVQIDNLRAR
jgi:ribonuclease Z